MPALDDGNVPQTAAIVNARSVYDCIHLGSTLRTNTLTQVTTIYPRRCRKWTCPFCCMLNEIQLREKVLDGDPSKMLTLTMRPDRSKTPREFVRLMRPKISRLYQQLRYTCGTWEAATFLELHRSGYPHWHALVRGNWISQARISEIWCRLTGSPIVDVRAIKDPKVAMRYVSKYVTKNICYTLRSKLGRTVTFTRAYLPKQVKGPKDPNEFWSIDPRRPEEICSMSYNGWVQTKIGNAVMVSPAAGSSAVRGSVEGASP